MTENLLTLFPPIANWLMLTLGVILIVLETTFLNFFILLWFGMAAVLVGIWGFFSPFSHGEYQLLATAGSGTILLLLFRKHFLPSNTEKSLPLETFQSGGTGQVIKQEGVWMIKYKGSWWRIANPNDQLQTGQSVSVKKIEDNQAWI